MTGGLTIREIAKALGGEASRDAVLAPGPGHSPRDRSLSIKVSFGSPDGFVVHSHAGDSWQDCRDYVRDRLGLPQDGWRDRPIPELSRRRDGPDQQEEARIARALAIWNEGCDPRGTVVERYLQGRHLSLDDAISGAVLRWHPRCPWRDREADTTIYVPAMIAAMRQIDGDRLTAVHRTRLTPDGKKVDRRMLGIAAGTAIKLDAITTELVVGEGIESALAGRQLGLRPAWAMASAGGIANLPVIAGVERLTLLTEHDETNERAVEQCGSRWHQGKRDVVLVEPSIGKDMNDAIRGLA